MCCLIIISVHSKNTYFHLFNFQHILLSSDINQNVILSILKSSWLYFLLKFLKSYIFQLAFSSGSQLHHKLVCSIERHGHLPLFIFSHSFRLNTMVDIKVPGDGYDPTQMDLDGWPYVWHQVSNSWSLFGLWENFSNHFKLYIRSPDSPDCHPFDDYVKGAVE